MFNEIWQNIKTFFEHNKVILFQFFLVAFVGLFLVNYIIKLLKAVFKKAKNKVALNFFLSLIKVICYVLIIIFSLGILRIPLGSLVTLVGAVGIALGLAMQSCVGNIANGIIIIFSKPFEEGDYIELNGKLGKVKNIRVLTTVLQSADNNMIIIPNSQITTNVLINYSATQTRRAEIIFTVNAESDAELIKKLFLDITKEHQKVLNIPYPSINLMEFSRLGLKFTAKFYVRAGEYFDVLYDINEKLLTALKYNKIAL